MNTPVRSPVLRQAVECRDLLTDASPKGLRVVCVSNDHANSYSHIYMESPVFTPDSNRFVFQKLEPDPPDVNMQRRWHEYWVCDIEDGFAIRRLTDEPNAIGPAVSPDGQWMYYFLNSLDPSARKGVSLRRVNLETGLRETVMVIDRPLPMPGGATVAPPSRLYSLASIREDGQAVATGAFFGDGKTHPGLWGVLVCDIPRASAHVAVAGVNYFNPHVQYARTTDPTRMRDLMVQQNFAADCDAMGKVTGVSPGCLVNIIRDDGTNFRRLPCGAGCEELCHGHQEWRGNRDSVLVGIDNAAGRPVIEATPVAADPDDATWPAQMPSASSHRNDVSRSHAAPQWGHTTTDLTGTRYAGDWRPRDTSADVTTLHIGTLADAPDTALITTYLLHPKSNFTNDQATHPHPCLSPDGRRLLFNTDFGGRPQVWMVDGFEYP